MERDLIALRGQVMDRADRALDAAWPARVGDEYVREMRWATGQLDALAAEMKAKNFDPVEQSRTWRLLGSLYSDLGPAIGTDMLLAAKKAYQTAEHLLEGQSDELERAKCDFNFANTLRQIDPNDIDQLEEAKRRLIRARPHFARSAPQHLAQVDSALTSVEALLQIAPIANTVKTNSADLDALKKELASGGKVDEVAEKVRALAKRDGGVAGIVGRLTSVLAAMPHELKQGERHSRVQELLQQLVAKVRRGSPLADETARTMSLLRERLELESKSGKMDTERAILMGGVLDNLETILSGGHESEGEQALLLRLQKLRDFTTSQFESVHYLSHGIARPSPGTRAAALVELNWQVRRFLLEEMSRPDKGEEESMEGLDLATRASELDHRIYETRGDDARTSAVEKDAFRPLVMAVREFAARAHVMPARPLWGPARMRVDSNAVFYAGPKSGKKSVGAACLQAGSLEVMAEPVGERYAQARWLQLQKAMVSVFDLRTTGLGETAAITYELGIALTLGKPVVVLVREGQTIPFDVDVNPVVLTGGPGDDPVLADAIDRSVVWNHAQLGATVSLATAEHVAATHPPPQPNIYVERTLRMLTEVRPAPDSLAISRILGKLFDFLKDGKTMLLHPWWPPTYPDVDKPRLFHVMPFGPKWANDVTVVARRASESAGVKYVRGDELTESNVVGSIWEEIARASHVLVDLTGVNANVALELGIAHTLGKPVLLIGQGEVASHLFASIRKLRVRSYSMDQLEPTLGAAVQAFVSKD